MNETHFPEYRATVYEAPYSEEWYWRGDDEPHEWGPYTNREAATRAMTQVRLRLLTDHREPLPESGEAFAELLLQGNVSWEIACERLTLYYDSDQGDYLGEDEYDLEELTGDQLDALLRVVDEVTNGWPQSPWPQLAKNRNRVKGSEAAVQGTLAL